MKVKSQSEQWSPYQSNGCIVTEHEKILNWSCVFWPLEKPPLARSGRATVKLSMALEETRTKNKGCSQIIDTAPGYHLLNTEFEPQNEVNYVCKRSMD